MVIGAGAILEQEPLYHPESRHNAAKCWTLYWIVLPAPSPAHRVLRPMWIRSWPPPQMGGCVRRMPRPHPTPAWCPSVSGASVQGRCPTHGEPQRGAIGATSGSRQIPCHMRDPTLRVGLYRSVHRAPSKGWERESGSTGPCEPHRLLAGAVFWVPSRRASPPGSAAGSPEAFRPPIRWRAHISLLPVCEHHESNIVSSAYRHSPISSFGMARGQRGLVRVMRCYVPCDHALGKRIDRRFCNN